MDNIFLFEIPNPSENLFKFKWILCDLRKIFEGKDDN